MADLGKATDADVRWHEYPIGSGAEWLRALVAPVPSFLLGLLASFVSMLVIGIMGEQGIFVDLLERWIPLYRAHDVSDNLDLVLRLAIVPLAAYAYLAFLFLAVAETAVLIKESKALADAADDADRTWVPPRSQMSSVGADPLEPLRVFAVANLVVCGIGVFFLVLFAVVESSAIGWLLTVVVAAYAGGLWLGVKKLQPRVKEEHSRRAELIAARWTEEDQDAARSRANKPRAHQSDHVTAPGDKRRSLAAVLAVLPAGLAFVGALVMQLALAVRHPGSSKYTLAEAREYGATGEALLDGIWWVLLAGTVVGLLMILASAILDQSGTSAMEAWLREQAEDPVAPRPPHKMLSVFSERRTLPLLRGFAFIAGLVCVFGTSIVLLGSFDMGGFADVYSDSDQVFGGYALPALGAIGIILALVGCGIVLQAWRSTHGREFRNLLRERWPVRPAKGGGATKTA